jgi:hypothetical protein
MWTWSVVAELALGVHWAVERELERIAVREVCLPALAIGRQPHLAALDALRDESDTLGAHGLSLGVRLAARPPTT